MIDYLIKDALIVDGSGNRPFIGDIAISGDMITSVGEYQGTEAKVVIQAKNKIVSPGFIDMHSHSDILFSNGDLIPHKVFQGVTTEIIGQDGISAAPLTDESKDFMAEIIEPLAGKVAGGWKPWDMEEFLTVVSKKKAHLNVMTLTGHSNLRMAVIGHKMVSASKDDQRKMGELLAKSIEQGSAGLSLGLIYPPCSYSDTDELIYLGTILKKDDAILVAHIRNEMDKVFDALDEMITIGKMSGCRIHISHLKCSGKNNWGKMPEILKKFDRALDQGVQISFDQYPYEASSTSLSLLVPGWAMEGGWQGFQSFADSLKTREKILLGIKESIESRGGANSIKIASVHSDKSQNLAGRSVKEISELWELPAEETVFKILYEAKLGVIAIYFAMSSKDVECAMTHHLHTVGSDGVLGDFPHPRAYGTFPRILNHFSIEKLLFPIETAIQRMTSTPAKIMRIEKRGLVKKGNYADLIIFEQDKFVDNATFDNPKQFASGLDWVFINGKPSIRNGSLENSFAGSVLKNTR